MSNRTDLAELETALNHAFDLSDEQRDDHELVTHCLLAAENGSIAWDRGDWYADSEDEQIILYVESFLESLDGPYAPVDANHHLPSSPTR